MSNSTAVSLQTFPFDSSAVRAYLDPQNAPWFCAKDICLALGIVDHKGAVQTLEEDEKGEGVAPTPGGDQSMLFVSESGLYSLIFRSRKPAAKQFRKWVTSEVLPALRRSGYYGSLSHGERLRASAQAVSIARAVAASQDAFVRSYLVDRLVDLSGLLGQAVPDTKLIGQLPLALPAS